MSRVFVLGNASVDISFRVPRLPLRGETLMAWDMRRAPGGKGLNQAVVAARAGAEVHFCAAIGDDAEGAFAARALAAESFAQIALHQVARATDTSVLLVSEDAQNAIISTGGCADALPRDAALAFVAGVQRGDLLLMQGNYTEEATRMPLEAARSAGALAMLNAAPIRWPLRPMLKLLDWVIVNEVEAEQATGESDPEQAARSFGLDAIVTCGAAGCVVASGGAVTRVAVPSVEAVDTTGAGDAFCGAFVARLASGDPVEHAVGLAQRAAALAVSRAGCFTALPSAAELRALQSSV